MGLRWGGGKRRARRQGEWAASWQGRQLGKGCMAGGGGEGGKPGSGGKGGKPGGGGDELVGVGGQPGCQARRRQGRKGR